MIGNSLPMVSDPAWFPSAAMQTLGAMYTVFVAIYVLVLQKEPTLYRPANIYFIVLSFIVGTTIILNAVVLFGLCSPYSGYGDVFYMAGFFAFVLSIIYILGFTIILSIRIAQG